MTETIITEDFWKPFGEAQWRDFATTVSASELQLRFAVARFNGATASGAAKIAGYAGDKDEIRRAGYSASRTTAVTALIELAETHAPESAGLTDREVDAKVAKLVRSPDPQISLKATELYDKRKQRAKEAASAEPETSYEQEAADLIALLPHEALGAYMMLESWFTKTGSIFGFPFLSDVAPILAKTYPGYWARWVARARDDHRQRLNDMASGHLLEGDELACVVKARLNPANRQIEASNG